MDKDYRDIILDAIYGEEYTCDIMRSYADGLVMGLVKWLSIDEAKRFCEIYELIDDTDEQVAPI